MPVSEKPTLVAEQASGANFRLGLRILVFVEVLLLSVWLGSMIFFSFAVAPSAFAVLPTRELAGAMVTSTIGKLETLGLVIGPLLILIQAASWRATHSSKLTKSLRVILVLVMIAAAASSRFWISPQMVSLRAAMGGHIDDVPAGDPLRMQFNNLHQYSVSLMGTAMVAGLVVMFLTVRSWHSR
ncbi:MAG TPA: DUF4149 domain-containing protein [Blastocatellia bacterium]|nr:DUF4149 domain-containing protein [Blastocatellia bacterium]